MTGCSFSSDQWFVFKIHFINVPHKNMQKSNMFRTFYSLYIFLITNGNTNAGE